LQKEFFLSGRYSRGITLELAVELSVRELRGGRDGSRSCCPCRPNRRCTECPNRAFCNYRLL